MGEGGFCQGEGGFGILLWLRSLSPFSAPALESFAAAGGIFFLCGGKPPQFAEPAYNHLKNKKIDSEEIPAV